jgi:predicted NBD/HSP70 family sugar kinase
MSMASLLAPVLVLAGGTTAKSTPEPAALPMNSVTCSSTLIIKSLSNKPIKNLLKTTLASSLKKLTKAISSPKKAFAELGAYLGLGFANIVNLLDPSMLVVGGGVAAVSELFLGEAKRTMEENTPSHRHKTKITQTKLGDNAGAIGAALLFR